MHVSFFRIIEHLHYFSFFIPTKKNTIWIWNAWKGYRLLLVVIIYKKNLLKSAFFFECFKPICFYRIFNPIYQTNYNKMFYHIFKHFCLKCINKVIFYLCIIYYLLAYNDKPHWSYVKNFSKPLTFRYVLPNNLFAFIEIEWTQMK